MSTTIGSSPPVGTPSAIGLGDMRGWAPPNGTCSSPPPWLLQVTKPIMSLAAAVSTYSPRRPMWPQLNTSTTPTEACLALSMASAIACVATVWP